MIAIPHCSRIKLRAVAKESAHAMRSSISVSPTHSLLVFHLLVSTPLKWVSQTTNSACAKCGLSWPHGATKRHNLIVKYVPQNTPLIGESSSTTHEIFYHSTGR